MSRKDAPLSSSCTYTSSQPSSSPWQAAGSSCRGTNDASPPNTPAPKRMILEAVAEELRGRTTAATTYRSPADFTPDRAAQSVTIPLVSAIRVILPGPEPWTNLAWEIGSNNTRVLDQMGPLKVVPASAALGSAQTTAASFYALKPGRSVLRFFLVRPNESEAVPAASCTLTVVVEE